LSESENNKDFSLNERSLFEKEKVLGSNPTPRTTYGNICGGSVRVMLGCRVMLTSIFSLPEDFGSVEVAYEFKAGVY